MYGAVAETPSLPDIPNGVTLLDVEERATGALQSLVLDHLLLNGGAAVWVDSHGNSTTQTMARLAPSMRVLDRVRVARAFTVWQHYSLLDDLGDVLAATDTTDAVGTGRKHASLVVVPEIDWFYRAGDLRRGEGRRMFAEAVARVSELAVESEIPILVTRTADDRLTRPLSDSITETIRCELTRFGPRFSGAEFETLVYPVGNGLVQTTLAYWRRVLVERHPAVAAGSAPSASREVSTLGSN